MACTKVDKPKYLLWDIDENKITDGGIEIILSNLPKEAEELYICTILAIQSIMK